MPMNGPTKLKRAVVKEEYVVLTGSVDKALILNQFVYWSERVRDFDLFIKEENYRKESHGAENLEELCHGWIYKTAQELSEETMLGKSAQTIRRLIDDLVEQGWIQARRNPKYKWDQTYQYRVNLYKIQFDLFLAGYPFDGYKYSISPTSKMEIGDNIALSILEDGEFKMEIQTDNNGDAIPEITTEITTEEIEEEETEIAEGEREILYIDDPDTESELSDTNPFSNPESIYEEPPSLQNGSNPEALIESVKKKLGIEDTLAFLLVARCQDKLDKVIYQLVNAKKPIQNMTAYLLTLMSRTDQWDLFMENVEN